MVVTDIGPQIPRPRLADFRTRKSSLRLAPVNENSPFGPFSFHVLSPGLEPGLTGSKPVVISISLRERTNRMVLKKRMFRAL